MKNRKAQAAMEYLMTYGWAILVIVVIIALLVYLRIFNIGQRVADRCDLPVGFTCTGMKLTDDSFTVTIGNGFGEKINICAITCDNTINADGVDAISTTDCDEEGEYLASLDPGRNANMTSLGGCTDSSGALTTVGSRYHGKLFVQYMVKGDSGTARIVEGNILATVQA
ncbi:hypothetical protein DRN67_03705 [Candidatus Micrarchaeota archaeon]|nr:MAG: hypothetical protein DRN67_03705 [Candidatus Micrarchaeota archaeon]